MSIIGAIVARESLRIVLARCSPPQSNSSKDIKEAEEEEEEEVEEVEEEVELES